MLKWKREAGFLQMAGLVEKKKGRGDNRLGHRVQDSHMVMVEKL